MKVNASKQQQLQSKPKKMSKADIEQMVKAKFGKVAQKKAPPPIEEKVELSSKKGVSNSDEENFGDIHKNSPDSEVTQEKLKSILKGGGFNFNDRERKALSEILK